jgi:hypothetical protein
MPGGRRRESTGRQRRCVPAGRREGSRGVRGRLQGSHGSRHRAEPSPARAGQPADARHPGQALLIVSALFVGGDPTAAGYLPRAKLYPDMPGVAPHQIAGAIAARRLDVIDASDQELRAAFVDDVLTGDGDETSLDERAPASRCGADPWAPGGRRGAAVDHPGAR